MPDILFERQRNIGHITLNRPAALNAVTWDMTREMTRTLLDWETDDTISAVVVTGAGDRAFCAGGDIKSLYHAGKQHADRNTAGELGILTSDFFRDEYALNYLIADYAKPYVVILDGVTMGGGVGLSIGGSHRIATERTLFAMPETKIGLIPDVGASYYLPRLGPIGHLLSLTGHALHHGECLQLGIATHHVPSTQIESLIDQFASDGIDATLQQFPQLQMHSEELQQLKDIADECFTPTTASEIEERLRRAGSHRPQPPATAPTEDRPVGTGPTGDSALFEKIEHAWRIGSPTSRKLTIEQMHRGATMTLAECLAMEFRLVQSCMQGHDFYEGVRAAVIDKDRQPKWSPASLTEVSEEDIQAAFESLGDRDLDLTAMMER